MYTSTMSRPRRPHIYTQEKKKQTDDRDDQYRILETVEGKFYVQKLIISTEVKGFIFKTTIEHKEWFYLTYRGVAYMPLPLRFNDECRREEHDTMSEALSFLKRVRKGNIYHKV
mgnify:CR=1 FL=1